MATEQMFFDSQLTGEVKPMTTDFTNFIRSGASISAVAASYAQSFSGTGGALASGSCAAGASGGSGTFVSPAPTDPGPYAFAVTATMSNGDVRSAIWFVKVDR